MSSHDLYMSRIRITGSKLPYIGKRLCQMTAQTPRDGKRATRELEKESVISASLIFVAVSPVFSSPTWWNCLQSSSLPLTSHLVI